jgi:undecaprenyl-diphosphatase
MFSAGSLLTTLLAKDLAWCQRANHRCSGTRWMTCFGWLSKLGDGYVWYALMTTLALFGGERGAQAAVHLALVGLASLLLYKTIKRLSKRERPLRRGQGLQLTIAPLDEFSFPSGHTLHAVAFSLLACHYYPMLALILLPLTIGIALSRVVLGLHYPSDVLAALVLGYGLYAISLHAVPRLTF